MREARGAARSSRGHRTGSFSGGRSSTVSSAAEPSSSHTSSTRNARVESIADWTVLSSRPCCRSCRPIPRTRMRVKRMCLQTVFRERWSGQVHVGPLPFTSRLTVYALSEDPMIWKVDREDLPTRNMRSPPAARWRRPSSTKSGHPNSIPLDTSEPTYDHRARLGPALARVGVLRSSSAGSAAHNGSRVCRRGKVARQIAHRSDLGQSIVHRNIGVQ